LALRVVRRKRDVCKGTNVNYFRQIDGIEENDRDMILVINSYG
jgi:hypothetical protein